jgi:pyridinium-3,5-bisthiocarboxylic acid mononucleotide nickel chelatase
LTGPTAKPMMGDWCWMRIAYLECFSGISGDMFLGALIDAGVPAEVFTETIKALGVDTRLEISRVDRSGISATKVDVIAAGEKELPREEFWAGQSAEQHGHDHAHAQSHGEVHSHSDDGPHGHSHPHEHSHAHHRHGQEAAHSHQHSHRGLKEIREIISKAQISQSAKDRAIKIFEALGAAEAKVHNSSIEDIHFHEVGAIDAIVDITCAAVGAEALSVDEWICSPLNVGGGAVVCAHGTFPIPAPATLELLKHAPVYSGEIQKELVTPTGAAIVSVLTSRFSHFPRMKPEKSGYGAGSRDFKGVPNVVRLTVGELAGEAMALARTEQISILEANVDDMTPQVFGYVMDRAQESGALDVFGTAVQMKKNRPGMLLTVLCRPEDSQRLTKLIFAETTTLGVRMRQESRAVLARRHVNVRTRWGEVRMKLANLNGSVSNYAPEYEDCRRIAEAQQVPLKTVMQEAIKIYLEEENG